MKAINPSNWLCNGARILAAIFILLVFVACNSPNSPAPNNPAETPSFVPVTAIANVPQSGTAGTPLTLTSTVTPSNATNKAIIWTINSAGTTGANITGGNVLNTTGEGTVIVTAIIANGTAQGTNYTQNFTITVSSNGTSFVAVSDILSVPSTATAGMPLNLSGTVMPGNATNTEIIWTVSNGGTTGASITGGNVLNTTGAGTAIVTATIANGTAQGTNYTKNFEITVNLGFVAVSGITNVPLSATAGIPLNLSGTVTPSNATNQTIVWTINSAGTTGASITGGNVLNTTGAGTAIVTATIINGTAQGTDYTQNSTITINIGFVAVSGITNVPTSGTAGTPLTLTSTVTPSNATNQAIIWTINSAGSTGANITSSNVLNTTGAGTAIITATIANGTAQGSNYTQNFTVTVIQPESFSITFTQIADEAPEITGPTIHRSSENGPRTATIELNNPGQYSSINWYIPGTTVSGVGPSFTLSTANILYNNIGQHFLTVEVLKGGVPYNTTIIFTVAQ